MIQRSPRQPLADIVDGNDALEEFTARRSFEDLGRDRMLRDAIERNIERISEASRRLPDDLKAGYPTIPWRDIAGIGNVLRHGYDAVAPSEIWDIVTNDLAPLRAAVEPMIRKVENGAAD